jgi:hypothetical protein
MSKLSRIWGALAVLGGVLVCAGSAAAAERDHDHVEWDRFQVQSHEPLVERDPGRALAVDADPAEIYLDSERFSPNADTRLDRMTGFVMVTRSGTLRVEVLDGNGAIVRALLDQPANPGFYELRWDGRKDGVRVPDAAYRVRATLTFADATFSTTEQTTRVDTSPPQLGLRRMRKGGAWNTSALPVRVRSYELAEITVRAEGAGGTRAISYIEEGGARRLYALVPGKATARASGGRRTTVRVRVRATDDAYNVGAWRTIRMSLSARARSVSGGSLPIPSGGGTGRFRWPVSGPITSRFGQRNGRLHAGIDIGVPTGRPIKSAAAGRVSFVGWMSGYGNTVIVRHSGGWSTLYAHQSRTGTRVGRAVRAGTVIGYVGSTGNSTGPHLHFETRLNNSPKDPLVRLR